MILKNIKDIKLTQKKPTVSVEIKKDSKGNADKIPWDLYINDVFAERYYYKNPCYQRVWGPYGSMRVERDNLPNVDIPSPQPEPEEPFQYIVFNRDWIMQNVITNNVIQKNQIIKAIVNDNVIDFSHGDTYYLNPILICQYTDKPNEIRAFMDEDLNVSDLL